MNARLILFRPGARATPIGAALKGLTFALTVLAAGTAGAEDAGGDRRASGAAGTGAVAVLPLGVEAPGDPARTGQVLVSVGWTRQGASELYLRHLRPLAGGDARLQWVAGLSATDRGGLWAGYGIAFTQPLTRRGLYLRASFMPGLWRAGSDVDLGGPLQFRTMIELGIPVGRGRLALAIDHRSNGDLYPNNPGLDTLSLTFAVPLGRR